VISVDPDFAGLWLVPRLADFYALVPHTLVEIIAERSLPALRDSRVSCAIHYAEANPEIDNGELLFRSSLFPVCAKSLMQSSRLDSVEDLRHHILLHDRSVNEWEEYLRSSAIVADIDVRQGIVFSETALCLDAAARGQGVAIGDDFMAATLLSEGRLVKPFGSAVFSKNAYYFVVEARLRQCLSDVAVAKYPASTRRIGHALNRSCSRPRRCDHRSRNMRQKIA
jgi:LysR family glycine cleavage system transcriptional activator